MQAIQKKIPESNVTVILHERVQKALEVITITLGGGNTNFSSVFRHNKLRGVFCHIQV